MAEDMTAVQVDESVQLCVQTLGTAGAPALLLIAGATWSMDWWDDDLCRHLVERGRRVVRYDQRDTGQSTSWPPGAPGYTGADLVTDALAVLDALGIDRAHVVGLSMGGGVAQRLALEHRERLATLTLISTTPIDPGIQDLPGMAPELQAVSGAERAEPDWSDREAAIDAIVDGERPYAGPGMFDEERVRAIATRVFNRTHRLASSLTNHFLLDDDGAPRPRLSRLGDLPTLVLHGTADPLFPIAHGRALAQAIPGAHLIELDGVGHQLPPPSTWDLVVGAVVDLTEQGGSARDAHVR
ncbi:MAG: alpha/beta fold hydrolase [Kineosporiaceae bacterium]